MSRRFIKLAISLSVILVLSLSLGFFIGDRLYHSIHSSHEAKELELLSDVEGNDSEGAVENKEGNETNDNAEDYEIADSDEIIESEKNTENTENIQRNENMDDFTQEAILGLNRTFKGKEAELQDKKKCYLTFDDGPTEGITPEILNILNEYDIKATFFILGVLANENREIVEQAFEDGHYIANHSYSHNYNYIYSSEENFKKEVQACNDLIEDITGERNDIFRFPGGSFGRYEYINLVESMGYTHIDWNALNGDAEALGLSKEQLINRMKETMYGQDPLIILMHDAPGKESTVEALPEIIEYIQSQGYVFETLEENGK